MIKLKRPLMGFVIMKATQEYLDDHKRINYMQRDALRSFNCPKNTLRILPLNKEIGLSGNDFERDLFTVRFRFKIITFKR